jgi:acetyltransferase-like isoleucine patch superfamily enzyme
LDRPSSRLPANSGDACVRRIRDGFKTQRGLRGDVTDDETPGDGDAIDHDADGDEAEPRHDRVTGHATPGVLNSLQHWTSAKSPLRVALNYVVVWIVRVSPSLKLKNWLLARIGVTVGDGVSWGLEATPDVFWPEHITLGDHVIVGYDATLLCHEFLQEEYRVGDVVVGDRAMIGAGAIVLPGVEIGEGAQVAANSLVTRDVEPGATVAGVPAEPMSDGGSEDATRDVGDTDVDPGERPV